MTHASSPLSEGPPDRAFKRSNSSFKFVRHDLDFRSTILLAGSSHYNRRPVSDTTCRASSTNFYRFHPSFTKRVSRTPSCNCGKPIQTTRHAVTLHIKESWKGSELTSRETTTEGTDIKKHGCKHPGIQRSDGPGVKKMHQGFATQCTVLLQCHITSGSLCVTGITKMTSTSDGGCSRNYSRDLAERSAA